MYIVSVLLANKTWIIRLFWAWYILVVIFFIYAGISDFTIRLFDEWGRRAGRWSVYFLGLTLTPGILHRFTFQSALRPLHLLLTSFRRQLGVSMYVLGVLHLGWMKVLPAWEYGNSLLTVNRHEFFGITALFLATPLFLTSNDTAVQWLGSHLWHRVHQLVYLVLWLIAIHVLLVPGPITLVKLWVVVLAGLETTSLVLSWVRKLKKNSATPEEQTDFSHQIPAAADTSQPGTPLPPNFDMQP